MTNLLTKASKKRWKYILLMAGKISTGCILSILIAYELGLRYCATAGIITVLSIHNTKVETIQTAGRRLLAFLLAIVIARLAFSLLGFTTVAFGLFMFVFVFICISLGWENAISMSAVLVTHFLEVKSMAAASLFNETMVFFIGAGMGIIMNLHLRRDYKTMQFRVNAMDEEMRGILFNMAERLVSEKVIDVSGDYFHRLEKQIIRAEEVAWNNHQNTVRERLFGKKPEIPQRNKAYSIDKADEKSKGIRTAYADLEYVQMRKKQCEVLYEMHKRISQVHVTPVQAEHIAVFLKKMAEEYHEENDGAKLLEDLEQLFQEMRATKLPVERTEFENRAVLFVFMLNIKEFLDIKNKFAVGMMAE